MIKSWKQLSDYTVQVKNPGDLKTRQENWLLDCITRNKNTQYGKTYHFGKIKTVDDYRKKVPIVSYQDLEHRICNVEKADPDDLFAGKAIAFERTSGSSGGQKLIPYSIESLQDFRQAILPWLSNLAEQFKITSGCAYWAISPATRQPEVTSAGIPVGMSDAAYLGEDLVPFFLEVSAVPYWVGAIPDVRDWQLATLYYLICSKDLSLISVWSPTFLLTLLDALLNRRKELETTLQYGRSVQGHELSANLPGYKSLRDYYESKVVKVLWPNLKVISCWADASSKPFYEILKCHFPGIPIQAKGLLLTEGVVTIPDGNNQTVLAADSGFYEFLDNEQNPKLAHELKAGEKYEVIMTTSGGLYRYCTSDRVICDGYSSDLPILRFSGREFSSDIVGEKLTEEFVTTCLEGISGFRMLMPVRDNKPGYLLVVEKQRNTELLVDLVETRLFDNPHYSYARKIGQLGRLTALQIKNPLDIYLSSPVHSGTRLGDIKIPSLCLKTTVFDDYIGVVT